MEATGWRCPSTAGTRASTCSGDPHFHPSPPGSSPLPSDLRAPSPHPSPPHPRGSGLDQGRGSSCLAPHPTLHTLSPPTSLTPSALTLRLSSPNPVTVTPPLGWQHPGPSQGAPVPQGGKPSLGAAVSPRHFGAVTVITPKRPFSKASWGSTYILSLPGTSPPSCFSVPLSILLASTPQPASSIQPHFPALSPGPAEAPGSHCPSAPRPAIRPPAPTQRTQPGDTPPGPRVPAPTHPFPGMKGSHPGMKGSHLLPPGSLNLCPVLTLG